MTAPVSQTKTLNHAFAFSTRPHLRVAAIAVWAAFPFLGGLRIDSLAAQEPTETVSTTVEKLIQQLSGNQFATRENAGQELFELGPTVLPQLRAARSMPRFVADNHECTMRLDQLIGALTKNDREARIESFLNGSDDDLKNWSEMRRWFGDQPRVREMFVELYRDHPMMIESLSGTAKELSDGVEQVKRKLFVERRIGVISLQTRVDVLAMLLPMTAPNFRPIGDEDMYLASLLQQNVADEFCRDRILGESFLRMVRTWMERSGLRNREFVLRLAMEWEMEIGSKLAKQTLATNPMPDLLARCLQTISRQGTREEMLVIADYLDDNRSVYRRDSMGQFQNDVIVADVAAATIAYLAQVPVTEIGFVQPAEHSTFGIIYEKLALPTPERETSEDDPDADEINPTLPPLPKVPPPDDPKRGKELLKAQLEAQRLRMQQLKLRAMQMRQQAQIRDPEIQLKEFADARAEIKAAVEKLLPKKPRNAPQKG